METPPNTTYIIRKGDYIKVGVTNNMPRRLREYRNVPRGGRRPADLDVTADPVLLFEAAAPGTAFESLIMAAFHDEHAVGEWFRYQGQTRRVLEVLALGNAPFPGRCGARLWFPTLPRVREDVVL